MKAPKPKKTRAKAAAAPARAGRKPLLSPHMQRYLIVGVSVYLFELLVIVVAQRAGASSLLAVGLSFWLGLLVSFGLQKLVTFGDKRMHHRIVLKQFALVTLLVLFNFGFTLLVTKLLSAYIPAVICRTLALGITTLWNFYLYKTRIFATSPPRPKSRPAKSKPLARLHARLAKRARLLTLTGGTAVVLLWTVLRHITNGVNFDVVGQIGLAQQWAAGLRAGAQLGTTNYLLKIPAYLVVNHLHFLSPMNRILLLAAVFNVVTFGLLFVLFEKILQLYQIKRRAWLYLGMAWLATIAGNVFWIDYANSRNLETVGGVLFIYLMLKYIKQRGWRLLVLLAVVGSGVFFADNLQFYVCATGICLFVLGRLLFRRTMAYARLTLAVLSVTALSYLGSQALFLLARHVLKVTFLTAPMTPPVLSLHSVVITLQGLFTNTLKIFGANFTQRPYGVSNLRELLNALVLVGLVWLLLRVLIKAHSGAASRLLMMIIFANYLVYAASGQVPQWETARYLIMVPLLTVLILALSQDLAGKKHKLKLQYAWLLIIIASSIMLVGALAINWPKRHAKDAHIGTVVSFMQANHYGYALASREVGITTTYFGQGRLTALPMACSPVHTLYPTNLFYDDAAFKGLYGYTGEVPIILQDNEISFGTAVCNRKDILAQFGIPRRELTIPGVGTAMVYEASSLHLPDIDRLVGHGRRDKPLPVWRAAQAAGAAVQFAASSTLPRLDGCSKGTTDVIVAHPDDDILFMNPALASRLTVDRCVRSVYVTAADDGHPVAYWQARQHGIESAYALMLGAQDIWTDSPADINGHTVLNSSLSGHPSVNLVFLHLPDGGVDGNGFAQTGHVSLQKLAANKDTVLTAVDGSASYNYADLTKLVATVIYNDKPDTIFTTVASGTFAVGDHSDHTAVGQLTLLAAEMAKSTALTSMYVGYPSNSLLPNLTADVSAQKRTIFNAYANDDDVICRSAAHACSIDGTYGNYFSRSYKIDQPQSPVQHPIPVVQSKPVTPPKQNLLFNLLSR